VDGLYRFDVEAFRFFDTGIRNPFLDVLMWALSYSGLGAVQVIFGLAFLVSRRTRHFVLPLVLSVLASGLGIAQVLKHVVERDRPSQLTWAVSQEAWRYSSFPSGHTTTAFAVATMLFLLMRGSRWRWLVFVWAALVGVSRVYRGVHWPTDVLAGACAGVFASCFVYLLLEFFRMPLSYSESASTSVESS
jgi:undecaprenyl-diphosphatase